METERCNGLDKVAQYLFEDSLFDGLDQDKVEVEPEVVLVSSDKSCTDEDS